MSLSANVFRGTNLHALNKKKSEVPPTDIPKTYRAILLITVARHTQCFPEQIQSFCSFVTVSSCGLRLAATTTPETSTMTVAASTPTSTRLFTVLFSTLAFTKSFSWLSGVYFTLHKSMLGTPSPIAAVIDSSDDSGVFACRFATFSSKREL